VHRFGYYTHKIKRVLNGVWKNTVPESLGVIGGTETYVCFLVYLCSNCVPAVQLAIKVGLTKAGNQEQTLKHSEKNDITLFYQFKVDI
jgi:hypothetical protein